MPLSSTVLPAIPTFLSSFFLALRAQTSQSDAKTTFFPQLDNALGEILGTDTAPELPVQDVHRDLAKWEAVNVFDRPTKLVGIEQGSFYTFGILLEPFIGAKARTRGATELSTGDFLLGRDQFNGSTHQVMVIRVPWKCTGFRRALGGFEDREL